MTDIHERRDTYSFRQIQTPYSNEYPAWDHANFKPDGL
jgi:hypothetical protein